MRLCRIIPFLALISSLALHCNVHAQTHVSGQRGLSDLPDDSPIYPWNTIVSPPTDIQIEQAKTKLAAIKSKPIATVNAKPLFACGRFVTRSELDLLSRNNLLQMISGATDLAFEESSRLLKTHAGAIQIRTNAIFVGETEGGAPIFLTPQSLNAAKTISANKLWPGGGAGYSLTGSGVSVLLYDVGNINISHQEFGNPSRIQILQNGANGSHATEMAGVISAAGVNPALKGTAPAATVKYIGASLSGPYNTLGSLIPVVQGLRVGNYSLGSDLGWAAAPPVGCSGVYWIWWGLMHGSDQSEDSYFGKYLYGQYASYLGINNSGYDELTLNVPHYLQIWAAGNYRNIGPASGTLHLTTYDCSSANATVRPINNDAGGYDTLSPTACLKNVLTIGAVNDLQSGYVNAQGVSLWTNSSVGPTDDGRIKPDLVANGTSVTSTTTGGATSFSTSSGTSSATASVTGAVALLMQHQRNLHPNWNDYYASTWKALLIHAADEAGTAEGPDFKHGWGLVNVAHSATIMSANATANSKPCIKEMILQGEGKIEFPVLRPTSGAFKVTIAWTDPRPSQYSPSTQVDGSTSVLVNDLDLRIIGPSGITYYPWKLDADLVLERQSVRELPATRGDNVIDNVEQVLVNNAPAGLYTVKVTHKGQLSSSLNGQLVSMILTGVGTPMVPDPEITETTYTSNGLVVSFASVPGGWYKIQNCENLYGNPQNWVDLPGEVSAAQPTTSTLIPWGALDGVQLLRVVRTE